MQLLEKLLFRSDRIIDVAPATAEGIPSEPFGRGVWFSEYRKSACLPHRLREQHDRW